MEVEPATSGDLPQIAEIENYSAAHSIANFNTQPIGSEERKGWFRLHAASGPHRILVAKYGGRVIGYAASSPYRDFEAFRETIEVNISLHHTARGQGIGTMLYAGLFECLVDEPIHVALANIALPNDASVALHRKFGFSAVGTFHEYAQKNGQYISAMWMQRPFRSFSS